MIYFLEKIVFNESQGKDAYDHQLNQCYRDAGNRRQIRS